MFRGYNQLLFTLNSNDERFSTHRNLSYIWFLPIHCMKQRGCLSFIVGLLLTLMNLSVSTVANAQPVLCPPNLDFENGDFFGWFCRSGRVFAEAGNNILDWNGVGELYNRHTIIDATNSGLDQFGQFPESPPNGSRYSIRLGNELSGAQAESVSYTYAIPANVTTFSVIYYYAVVLQNPSHGAHEQPRFMAKIIDESTNQDINCVSFDFTASGSLPGFVPSQVNGSVLYKDWTPITIDLSSFAGRTIRLEFISSDCTPGGHFGYAYIDVDASCNGVIIGSTVCAGETSTELVAPYGFQSYSWFSDNSFSTQVSTNQTLPLDPAPPDGTMFPVIVTPYTGFGCRDTLYAVISSAPKPVSNAGADAIVCRNQPLQIGGAATLGYAYNWTPMSNLNNPVSSSPWMINHTFSPVQYIVKTTDLSSGCFTRDTIVVTTPLVDTSLRVTGKQMYCENDVLNTSYAVGNGLTSIQWYQDTNPLTGNNATTYQPASSGNYWAQISQNGCTDSTRQTLFMLNPVPLVDFAANKNVQCEENPFQFSNNTTLNAAQGINYVWKFGDGTITTSEDPEKLFIGTGAFNVELVATTVFGCADSIEKVFTVVPNGRPNFVWDSVCLGRPAQFFNRSNENGAPSATYLWEFGEGFTDAQKDPSMVNYTARAVHDVKLTMTTPGCEDAPKSIVKSVWVNRPATPVRYPTRTIAEGYPDFVKVRDSVGSLFSWQPQVQLSSYNARSPFFTPTNDIEYFITITDRHTCTVTDTLELLILKKPGIYLPSAFSPNGDGLNDLLKPYLVQMKSMTRFTIYNRGGQVVFRTAKAGEGWDGKYMNRKVDTGVYVWTLEFISLDDKPQLEKGVVTLIR